MGQSEVKRQLAQRVLRWEDNIKTGLKEKLLQPVDYNQLAQDRDTCE
jgi:hypothetical protein